MNERKDLRDMPTGHWAMKTLIRSASLAALLAGAGLAPRPTNHAAPPPQVTLDTPGTRADRAAHIGPNIMVGRKTGCGKGKGGP